MPVTSTTCNNVGYLQSLSESEKDKVNNLYGERVLARATGHSSLGR